MNRWRFAVWLIVSLPLIVSGCAQDSRPPQPTKESKIQASLDKLDPADRKLAEEQKYCAVETENLLGVMGKPIKVLVNDQPVFLCCKGCEKRALKEPDKTLATVKRLKDRSESHESED